MNNSTLAFLGHSNPHANMGTIQSLEMPRPPQGGLQSIHLRNSRAQYRSPSSLLHRNMIMEQVKSQAELRNLIAIEDDRRLKALSLAL